MNQVVKQFAEVVDGESFTLDGKRYIRVPTMRLSGWGANFIINCLLVEDDGDSWTPLEYKAHFLTSETEVTCTSRKV